MRRAADSVRDWVQWGAEMCRHIALLVRRWNMNPTSEQGDRLCSACRQPIDPHAYRCHHCHATQGLRRFVPPGPVIATAGVLVALLQASEARRERVRAEEAVATVEGIKDELLRLYDASAWESSVFEHPEGSGVADPRMIQAIRAKHAELEEMVLLRMALVRRDIVSDFPSVATTSIAMGLRSSSALDRYGTAMFCLRKYENCQSSKRSDSARQEISAMCMDLHRVATTDTKILPKMSAYYALAQILLEDKGVRTAPPSYRDARARAQLLAEALIHFRAEERP